MSHRDSATPLRQRLALAFLALAALLAAAPALQADSHEPSGFFASFERDYERSSGHLVELAEAIPADKYGWRPAEGVRSVSETLVHVAGANFFLASALGVAPPEGLSREMEQTITAKDDVLKLLRDSIENVKQAAAKGGDLDKEVEVFGRTMQVRDVFMILAGHCHEHLGQSIAYARMNGIAPPWSQPSPPPGSEGEAAEGE